MCEAQKIHKFEAAGLGKAPFAYVGMTEKKVNIPGHSTRPGSSCDYCGTGIQFEYWIKSSDGKVSKVGSDCIYKIGDTNLVKFVDAEKQERDRKNRIKQGKSDKEEFFALVAQVRHLPHPNAAMAKKGLTLADYYEFVGKNCGNSGIKKWVKKLRNQIAGEPVVLGGGNNTLRDKRVLANAQSAVKLIKKSVSEGGYESIRESFEDWLSDEPTEEYFARIVANALNVPFTDDYCARCKSYQEVKQYQHEQYGE